MFYSLLHVAAFNKSPHVSTVFISIALVILAAAGCFLVSAYVDYKVVAFILLLTVSLVAIVFDIVPVLVAATLSALIWNFFL